MHADHLCSNSLFALVFLCVTIWFSGEVLLPVGCPVVLPMAKFISVKKEENTVALTPIVAGPGLKKALKENLRLWQKNMVVLHSI